MLFSSRAIVSIVSDGSDSLSETMDGQIGNVGDLALEEAGDNDLSKNAPSLSRDGVS